MKLHVVKLLILLLACSALYADGIRQSSGPVGQHTPSPGSHSRERVVIDGQYSAMPSGSASEVQGLASTGQVGAVVVPPGEVEETGGSLVGPPQPMESASPEPNTGLLLVAIGIAGIGKIIMLRTFVARLRKPEAADADAADSFRKDNK